MNKKIVIAGGSGFIGRYLAKEFTAMGYEIIIISREIKTNSFAIKWDDEEGIIQAMENSEMLINLAGKSVDCRYNEKNKKEILRSRTETTQALGEAILKCKNPPSLWINSSTATIYRHAMDRYMTESKGEIGMGFSVEVAKEWERVFFAFQPKKTRQVALRTAIVLAKDGGVMKPYINLVRLGLGGKQGEGNQMFSFIHIEDLFNIILFVQSHLKLEGVINCSSPYAMDNKTFMSILRRDMHIKIGLPAPAWLLKIGAFLINTEPELVLKSRWIMPQKLLDAGYKFKYPAIESALKNILK